MQVTKKYKAGGFFGNSQDKFSHMAGAEAGFDRKKFRELRRKKRRGESLSGVEGQRLQYMKSVRGDRIKKGIAGAALAGTAAAVAGPAISAKLAAKTGAKGLAGLAGKGTTTAGKFGKLKSLFGKAKKVKRVADEIQDFRENLTPEQEQQIDEGNFGQPDMYGKYGMRVLKDGGMMQFNPTEREILMAMLGAKLPR